MPNGLRTLNVRAIPTDNRESTRHLYIGKDRRRYKRSNFKFAFKKTQLSPLIMNNRLLRSLYRSSNNISYFDNDSNEEYNGNKDHSWDDTFGPLADEPDMVDAMNDSPSNDGRESYDDNDSSDGNDSFDDMAKESIIKLENWDMYDSINQVYLELGKSGKAQSQHIQLQTEYIKLVFQDAA